MTQTRLTCRKPMTLFLIVALIVLVISFSQSVNNSYANEQYRQSTITNVKLERQLKDEWREKIDKKIDELNPPAGEMFATLISLYNYYDVPLYGLVIGNIADAEKQLEETKVKAKEDETYAAKNLYSFDEFGFAVHDLSFPAVVYDYGKDPPSTLLHIFISKFAFNDGWRKYYENLATLLTQRSLKAKGFNLSRDGVHDSDWQEREKQQKKLQELRDKYPWNYPRK